MQEFRGKVAFITGAASGTGRAVALALARRGVHIAAFDRWENDRAVGSTVKLERLRRDIEQMGVRCLTLCGDAMKDIDVMVAVAEAVVEFHRIDILFNDATDYVIHRQLSRGDDGDGEVNFRRMWLAARHVIPRMLRRGEGTVITCTTAGLDTHQTGWALYGAASPFKEAGDANIRINAICPATSSDVCHSLQQDGWTQLSQSNHDLVTAVQDLVTGTINVPWRQNHPIARA